MLSGLNKRSPLINLKEAICKIRLQNCFHQEGKRGTQSLLTTSTLLFGNPYVSSLGWDHLGTSDNIHLFFRTIKVMRV